MLIDDRPVSLEELAGVLGVNKRNLQNFVERGILVRVGRGRFPLGKSIRAYCDSLRETAANRDHFRVGTGLAAERERIAREQGARMEGNDCRGCRSRQAPTGGGAGS